MECKNKLKFECEHIDALSIILLRSIFNKFSNLQYIKKNEMKNLFTITRK